MVRRMRTNMRATKRADAPSHAPFVHPAAKRTSFRRIFRMLRVPVKSREERSNLETGMLISRSTMREFIRLGPPMKSSEDWFDKVFLLNVKVRIS